VTLSILNCLILSNTYASSFFNLLNILDETKEFWKELLEEIAKSCATADSPEDRGGPARLFYFLVSAFQKDLEIWFKHGRGKPSHGRNKLPILHYVLGSFQGQNIHVGDRKLD